MPLSIHIILPKQETWSPAKAYIMLLHNSLKLFVSNPSRAFQLSQCSVRYISTISETELQKAWEWRSKFNRNTIDRKYGKISSPAAKGLNPEAKKTTLHYPISNLLRQLPAITHQDVKRLGDSSSNILIKSHNKHKDRDDLWDKLNVMVKDAIDLSIPKKLDEYSVRKVKAGLV